MIRSRVLERERAREPLRRHRYLEFSGALSNGSGLDAKQREIVALTVAQANGCEYCLAAHSTIGKMVGLSPEAIEAARRADGFDEPGRELARFADAVIQLTFPP